MQQIELLDLLKSGVHFGHRASKWHPNMRTFIYGEKGGIHIIDLDQTRQQLEKAYNLVRELTGEGQKVLFVGTKRQAHAIIGEVAQDCGMPYVNERWIGGLLTNWGVVGKMAKRLTKLKKQKEVGEWSKYTKKEALMMQREVDKLQRDLGGIEGMERPAEIIFITDMKHEATALREARKRGLTVIAIADSNVDPTLATVPIPGNDDAVKSIDYITRMIGEAAKEGVAVWAVKDKELKAAAAIAAAEKKKKKQEMKKMKPGKKGGKFQRASLKAPKGQPKAEQSAEKPVEKKPAEKPVEKKAEPKAETAPVSKEEAKPEPNNEETK